MGERGCYEVGIFFDIVVGGLNLIGCSVGDGGELTS